MPLTDSLLLDPLAPPRMDIWVALRTDGVKGSGTEEDPYDGSTWASPIVTVGGLISSGYRSTATTSAAHGVKSGDLVLIAGVTGPNAIYYNGSYVVSILTTTSFQYTMWNPPSSGSQPPGSITCRLTPYRFDAVM